MLKTLLALTRLALLTALLCFACPAPAAPLFDSGGSARTAAQDGGGTVWAVPPGNGSGQDGDGKISRREAGKWITVPVPEAAGLRLLIVTRGPDGFVYALWQTPPTWPGGPPPPGSSCLITLQRGVGVRVLARFPVSVPAQGGFPALPSLFAGAGGEVWVSGPVTLLHRITASGAVQTFPLRAEWFFDSKVPTPFPGEALMSCADNDGHRWFWGLSGLRGALRWDGKALASLPALTGPNERVSLLAPRDAGHLWLVRSENYSSWPRINPAAWYTLDSRTLAAVPEHPPLPLPSLPFGAVTQVFSQASPSGGDWYAVTREQASTTSLWRRRAGRWRKIIPELRASGGYSAQSARVPWLAAPSGLWIGGGGGAWWLPRGDAPPLWVDWRRGLPPSNISGLFPLPSGKILAFGDTDADAEFSATPPPVRPLPPGVSVGGLGAPPFSEPPAADLRRHLWLLAYSSPMPALAEWDGRGWKTHAPPKAVTDIRSLYACDTLGRLWLTTSHWNPPAQTQPVEGRAVYDPARDAWTDYKTVPDALAAAAALPGMRFLPRRDLRDAPDFSGDGRVTYADQTSGTPIIALGDGKAWRRWEARDILPSYPYSNLPYPPHFNAAGHLEVSLSDAYWQWTAGGGWQPTGEHRDTRPRDSVPPGGPAGLWGDPAADPLGVKWFVRQGAVYAAGYGLWARQAALSAPGSPFALGYSLEDVFRDPAGRFFFVSRPAGRYDLVVWSPPPVPKPGVAVAPRGGDGVQVRFSSALPGPHWIRWRLNGGAWSAPTTAKTQSFTGLPRGDYALQVQALDSRLQLSPAASAAWRVTVAPEAQMAHWVAALSAGPDPAREAAVAGLLRQPGAALPALKAARPGASDLGRWWMDAAVQQIEQQQIEQRAEQSAAGVSGPARE